MVYNNQRGFTLIELLGAVIVLGILTTMGMVSVSKVIDKSHDKFDNNQYELFLETAQTYFTDDKTRMPITPNERREVTLQQLIDNKYLSELLDSKKDEFDYSKSKVEITRLTTGKYKYEAVLFKKSGAKMGNISRKDINENSNITFKLQNRNNYYKEGSTYYVNDIPKIEVNIYDNDGISGYQYIVYKDGKQFKKSDNVELHGGGVSKL